MSSWLVERCGKVAFTTPLQCILEQNRRKCDQVEEQEQKRCELSEDDEEERKKQGRKEKRKRCRTRKERKNGMSHIAEKANRSEF